LHELIIAYCNGEAIAPSADIALRRSSIEHRVMSSAPRARNSAGVLGWIAETLPVSSRTRPAGLGVVDHLPVDQIGQQSFQAAHGFELMRRLRARESPSTRSLKNRVAVNFGRR
jgi:hypothetical protein